MKSLRRVGPALAAALFMAAPLASGQATKPDPKPRPEGEMASGAVVKSEAIANQGDATSKRTRLTVNTAVVWRDWSRDQASLVAKTPAEAAEAGKKSVGAAGQPQSAENLVTVELTPETKIEVRYRSATDELSQGAKTPEGAAKAEAGTDPADTTATKPDLKKGSTSKTASKPVKFTADDLKAGIYVEVEYRHAGSSDRATLIRVVRPVGGPQVPAAAEKPTSPQ